MVQPTGRDILFSTRNQPAWCMTSPMLFPKFWTEVNGSQPYVEEEKDLEKKLWIANFYCDRVVQKLFQGIKDAGLIGPADEQAVLEYLKYKVTKNGETGTNLKERLKSLYKFLTKISANNELKSSADKARIHAARQGSTLALATTPAQTDLAPRSTSASATTPAQTDLAPASTSASATTPAQTDLAPASASASATTPAQTDLAPASASASATTPAQTNLAPASASASATTPAQTDLAPASASAQTKNPAPATISASATASAQSIKSAQVPTPATEQSQAKNPVSAATPGLAVPQTQADNTKPPKLSLSERFVRFMKGLGESVSNFFKWLWGKLTGNKANP